MTRKMPDGEDTYGGVCAFVHKSLKAKVDMARSSPDTLVLKIGDMHFINAYVAGEHSSASRHFADWQAQHPWDTFSVLVREMSDAGLAFSVHGDLNGRSGALCPLGLDHPPRVVDDIVVNGQGRKLVDLCEQNGLQLVNGCTLIPGVHHGFTFFGRVDTTSEIGKSTVDYVLTSRAAAGRLSRMDIALPRQDCSDHAATRPALQIPSRPTPSFTIAALVNACSTLVHDSHSHPRHTPSFKFTSLSSTRATLVNGRALRPRQRPSP
ncbi:hypothetical protein R3P38DRAFT_3464464 [Favolaschia claudopus]|uniref:Uncharacterized protein n=1 Tax=Favolaschia claudopus TaxID=2862362 RepID=A0AAV9ZHC4_9AGAR